MIIPETGQVEDEVLSLEQKKKHFHPKKSKPQQVASLALQAGKVDAQGFSYSLSHLDFSDASPYDKKRLYDKQEALSASGEDTAMILYIGCTNAMWQDSLRQSEGRPSQETQRASPEFQYVRLCQQTTSSGV